MPTRSEQAELLIALFALGCRGETLDLRGGVLDRTLHSVKTSLPGALSDEHLTFSVTSVGLRCLELPEILVAAQEMLLINVISPGFVSAEITIDEGSARQITFEHELTSKDAADVGRILMEELNLSSASKTASQIEAPMSGSE